MTEPCPDLQLQSLLAQYNSNEITPADILRQVFARIEHFEDQPIWISRIGLSAALKQLEELETKRSRGAVMPLFGVPFAIKDNIDAEGWETTAACPSYGYQANASATVVQKLTDAGAILIGKTNMDQFATGLVGTRSPYGACHNAFNPNYISGGSSSGSALAVALGLVSFSLGTDTAGSGRVPAGFNNIVGLKPTPGALSTNGVVPACRSLDCVSIFAGNALDAAQVLDIASGHDPADAYSRKPAFARTPLPDSFTFGVPKTEQLKFFGNHEYEAAYEAALSLLESLGGQRVALDFTPFFETAALLYSGPWVAERDVAVGDFVRAGASELDPAVASIIKGASGLSAQDVFKASYQLERLRKAAAVELDRVQFLSVPTAPTLYTLEQVAQNPIELNSHLGTYTNFVNLLGLCGVAVPTSITPSGLPFGVTLLGKPWQDQLLSLFAVGIQQRTKLTVGATNNPLHASTAPCSATPQAANSDERIQLAVCGAHLRGQPLHHQLESLDARFVTQTSTAASYRFFALQGTTPEKPGLERVEATNSEQTPKSSTEAIEVEVYELTPANFGRFVAMVPPPLTIGNVELESGGWVKGFLCEGHALKTAKDISHLKSWRRYQAERLNAG